MLTSQNLDILLRLEFTFRLEKNCQCIPDCMFFCCEALQCCNLVPCYTSLFNSLFILGCCFSGTGVNWSNFSKSMSRNSNFSLSFVSNFA